MANVDLRSRLKEVVGDASSLHFGPMLELVSNILHLTFDLLIEEDLPSFLPRNL